MLEVRAVFIRHPEAAGGGQDEAFGVEAGTGSTWAIISEAVAREGGGWEGWEAGESYGGGGVKASEGVSGGVGEKDSVVVSEDEVFVRGGVGCGGEHEGELLHPRLVCRCAFGVPGMCQLRREGD